MTRWTLALLAALLAFAPAQAADNAITLQPGVGVTERSIDVGAGVQAPGVVLVNSAGTNLIGAGSSVPVSGTLAATQSGTWNIGTVNAITTPVAATQSGAWTVGQGTGGASAWLVTGTGGTFPVTQSGAWTSVVTSITNPVAVTQSGTWNLAALTSITNPVAATQSGTWTVNPGNTANTTAWLVTGTGGIFPATQSGTWNITNISGTVSLPTGASTAALQPSNNTLGATTSGQTGTLVMGLVTTAAPTYTTGTVNGLSLDAAGNLRVNVTSSSAGGTSSNFGATFPASGTALGLTNGTNMVAWSASSNYGTAPAAIAVPAVNAFVTNTNNNGPTTMANGSPVSVGGGNSSAAISVSTATTTQLLALSGTTKIYVMAYDVIAGGTGNITFEYGTGSNCGTGTTALTGAYNLTAQAGIAKGDGSAPVLIVPAGNALCALTSAAVQMSGSFAYQQF